MMEIANAGDTDPNEATDNLRAYEWLNKTLEAGMAMQYRILVFHRQVFSSLGNDESLMKYMIPIIEKYNVSLTLYGHMHEYARYYHNGHNYICLGGGGGMQNSYIETQNITQKSAMGASFTKLYFTEEKITIKTFSPTYDVMDNIVLNFKNGMMVPEKITTYGGL